MVRRYIDETNTTKFRRVETLGFAKEEAVKLPGDELPGEQSATAPKHIGGALYLSTGTRPDITTVVGMLSRKVKSWTRFEDRALRRMMAYLAHHSDWGLVFTPVPDNGNEKILLDHYVGSSLADDHDLDTGRSTGGWAVFFSYTEQERAIARMTWALLDWASKLLTATSPSTADAEYCSAALSLQRCA